MTTLAIILKEAAVDPWCECTTDVERIIRGRLVPTVVKAAHKVKSIPTVIEPRLLAILAVVRLPVDVENIHGRSICRLLQVLPSDIERRDRGDRQSRSKRVRDVCRDAGRRCLVLTDAVFVHLKEAQSSARGQEAVHGRLRRVITPRIRADLDVEIPGTRLITQRYSTLARVLRIWIGTAGVDVLDL